MLCKLSLLVAEATDSGLKCFVGVSVEVIGLERSGLLVVNKKSALWAGAVLWVPFGSAKLVA